MCQKNACLKNAEVNDLCIAVQKGLEEHAQQVARLHQSCEDLAAAIAQEIAEGNGTLSRGLRVVASGPIRID